METHCLIQSGIQVAQKLPNPVFIDSVDLGGNPEPAKRK
jgi:hypothetical protein